MPWFAWVLFFTGPAIVGLLRVATWTARILGYGVERRPGYVDLTRRPR